MLSKIKRVFKPGQLAEARSFANGYRGAWFRCKIKNVRRKDSSLLAETEYYDFPDQKVRWEKLYRKPNGHKDRKLMFRPQYPAFFKEGEVPDISSSSEVAVILDNAWQEGDLVDWFSDGCYWSGKLTQVLENDKLKLELFPPPDGEGSSYEVSGKDLRPSLDWSLEDGWTLPKPVGKSSRSSCARLVKPSNEGSSFSGAEVNCTLQYVDEGINDINAPGLSNTSVSYSLTSDISDKISKRLSSSNSYTEEKPMEVDKDQNATQSASNKTNDADNVSSLPILTEGIESRGGKDGNYDNPSKKTRTDKSTHRNTMSSNDIEAAVLDLEELRNRVKWIKDILEFGMPLLNSKPSWMFVEHRASSSQN